MLNPRVCVALVKSDVKIRVNKKRACVIYLRDDSVTHLIVHTSEKIIVHTVEDSLLSVEVGSSYKPDVLVLSHSKRSVVFTTKNVKLEEDVDYLKS